MSTLEQLYAMPRSTAIATLQTRYDVFCDAMQEVLTAQPLPPITPADDSPNEQMVCRMAQELREQGYTFFRGCFSDEAALDQARKFARIVKARADHFAVADEPHLDQEMGGLLWARKMAGCNTRVSFAANRMPPLLAPFCGNSTIEAVMQRAIACNDPIAARVVVVDNLQPSTEYEFQWWHFDRIRDQYKAMILLNEVDVENGPMKIVPGTHKWIDKRHMLDFASYAGGQDYGDLSHALSSSYRQQTVLVTGRPGDVVIFDTRAFHAHGRPARGERLTSTIYFNGLNTALNRYLTDFNPPGQII
jgi:hypothetical protein